MYLAAQSSRYAGLVCTVTRRFKSRPQIYILKVPFPQVPRNAVSSAIRNRKYTYPRPDEISSDGLWNIIQQCMAYKSDRRPNAARVNEALLTDM